MRNQLKGHAKKQEAKRTILESAKRRNGPHPNRVYREKQRGK